MNYAAWIEEKNLKKTFIMATLASTLVGTFTASMGLYDRVSDKREQHKQKTRDSKQDGEIKQLKDEFSKAQKAAEDRQKEIDRLKNGGGGGGYGGRGSDDVGYNLGRDAAMVQRMYDDGFGRYGNRFAQGDAIAENQLQAQIISLQQTVITVLQDALAHDRQLTRTDQAKLIAASNAAREGSLDALHAAQQRLSSPSSPPRSIAAPPPPRSMTAPPGPRSIAGPPSRAPTAIMDAGDHLFCRYALDLQYTRDAPLASSFAPGGSCACPACGIPLDVTADDFWMIGKRTDLPDGFAEVREFRLSQRFAIKCHTPDGEYACTICNRNRDVDAICRTVDALVKHVGTFHDAVELEKEPDLREVVVEVEPRRSLQASRAGSPPRSVYEERMFEERRESVHARAPSEVGRREFEFEERRGSVIGSQAGRREMEHAPYR